MKTLSRFSPKPNVQIIPSSKGEVMLAYPLPPTHSTITLIFLTDLRNENLSAYLDAIAHHRFGEAAFLEGGVSGIDAVINNLPQSYETLKNEGEATLQQAITLKDWAAANWWKGYVCGLELAIHVQKIPWYKPTRYGDRLLDWFARTRGEFA